MNAETEMNTSDGLGGESIEDRAKRAAANAAPGVPWTALSIGEQQAFMTQAENAAFQESITSKAESKAQREDESFADYDERRADENEADAERYRAALESIAAMVPTEDEWRSAADFMEATADIVNAAGVPSPPHYAE